MQRRLRISIAVRLRQQRRLPGLLCRVRPLRARRLQRSDMADVCLELRLRSVLCQRSVFRRAVQPARWFVLQQIGLLQWDLQQRDLWMTLGRVAAICGC